ncbi:YihY/virulence factor BrkB family protein [Humibacillus xanthopallidus]|uniref:YihY/virulence factor BrkB family protein n=1 Tax=Humibacillus xanthopallidus TaxID=412689 RepID=UPI00384E10FC
MSVFQKALDRLKTTRAWSAWQRYGSANGDLLAAGVAYFAFFSIFPALALAFAIFGFVLQDRPDLIATIADSLNQALPGMVKTADNPDGIISISAPASLTLTVTGIIAFITLLLAGLGWVGSLRTGIRTVFGLKASDGNAVTTKLRDLGVLTVLGVLIAVSAILTSAIGGLAGTIADWVGLPGGAVLVAAVGLLAGILFDTLIMVVLLRLLTGAPLPWRNVRQGALLGGAVIAVLKLFGGFLISHATGNPLLSAVAIPVGLLFWLNVMSRVVLLASSWAADDVDLATLSDEARRTALATTARPPFLAPLPATADLSRLPYAAVTPVARPLADVAASGSEAGQQVSGAASGERRASRAVDRVSIAAGAVVGAAGAGVAAALRRRRG